jgi:multidrug resistance protein
VIDRFPNAIPPVEKPKRSLYAIIFLTILVTTIGFGVIFPVLPLYAKSMGASDSVNGWLAAIFSLAQFACAPLWGRLSDRIGRRPVMLISILGSSAAYLLTGWASTIPILFAARLLDGATGGSVAVAQACLADITTPEERSKAMGLVGVAFGLGFVIGPFVGGELSHWFSPSAPFYFIALLSLLNAGWIYQRLPETLAPEHRSDRHPHSNVIDIFRQENGGLFARLVAIYFLFLTGFSIMTFVFTLFNHERFRFEEADNGRLFGLIGLVGIIVQGGVLRRLLPRTGEKPLTVIGSAALAVGFFLLPLAHSVGVLIGLSCLIAVANSLIQPTLNGLASRSMSSVFQGRAMGLFQSAASLGRAIGPVLGGWLLHLDAQASYGRTPLWIAGGLVTVMFLMTLSIPKFSMSAKSPAESPGLA